jgi:hypothetical protein
MTAAEAIANMRTDLAELEARAVVRPGLIAAKRSWVDTVHHELADLQKQVDQLKEQCNQEHQHRLEAELRTGMLANVIRILGFCPMVHLRRPLTWNTYTNPDVYKLAAEQVDQQDLAEGLKNRMHLLPYRKHLSWLLNKALWHARLTLMLQPYQHLIAQHQHGQEERTAA